MSDQSNQQPDPNRPLSEISHLFLSSIRDRQTGGAPRPVRKPPTAKPADAPVDPKLNIDLTPEEFAQVYGGADKVESPEERRPLVSAVIAAHLNGHQVDRVREYVSHLAATHGRVGLIELDAAEFRVMLFERRADGANIASSESAFTAPERLDPKRMAEALEELNWDVDRWVLLLPSIRTPEARFLLAEVDHWTLLATCDHDGVVACYRSLKGLADLARRDSDETHPKLSLALLDVRSLDEADRVTLKLASVCQQFLSWPLESEPVVKPAPQVADHLVLCCRAGRDTLTESPQFRVVHEFLTRSAPAEEAIEPAESLASPVLPGTAQEAPVAVAMPAVPLPHMSMSQSSAAVSETRKPMVTEMRIADREAIEDVSDVIDLAGDDTSPAAVVSAVIKGGSSLAETPLKAPMCRSATLTVSRERKLVLVAVARQGLCDLRDIAQAYRWMSENGQLIAMALPQFAIEPNQKPRLQLLVDQSDVSAEVLQPLLQSSHVTVQTYRKLRWGGKTGLLLEAA